MQTTERTSFTSPFASSWTGYVPLDITDSQSHRVAMDLLERGPHRAALDGWLREAASGEGRFVLIGGEAGVGKTSLVNQFSEDVRESARVLRGACDDLSTPRPLGPLLDIAAEVGGDLDRLLSETPARDLVFRAVLAEINRCLSPTVVVIEDAHWADEATLDLLRFLGRRLESARVMLIVTYRDDEVGSLHPLRMLLGDLATTKTTRRMTLAPLSREAIRELADGSGVDPVSLYDLTGGNPFFASEVLAAKTGSGIPAAVNDAVLARASRLPEAERAVLDAAAVIGSLIGADLLTEVSGATPQNIEACLESGMIVPLGEHSYAFRHELECAAIYDAISPPRRRVLHARVLSALQAGPASEQDLARLAHHAEAAGDREAVLHFAPLAARRALELRAHREAAAQYARALRFAADLPMAERAELLEADAYEYYLIDRLPEAIELQREALQLWRTCKDRLREGDALRKLSRYCWFIGRNDDAVSAAEEALAVLEALPPGRELAMALSNRAQLHMLSDEADAAISWGDRAVALAESLGETEILIHALANAGSVRMKNGDERGRAELERSLMLARGANLEEHVARALTNLSWASIHLHDLHRADAYLDDGIVYTTDHDLDAWRLYMVTWRGYVQLIRGNWSGADEAAAEVLAIATTSPVTRIAALTLQGLVRARQGDPDAGEPLDEALSLAEPTGEIQRLQPVRAARTEAAWLDGDLDRAVAEIRPILDLVLRRGSQWEIGDTLLWLKRSGASIDDIPAIDLSALPEPYRLALTGDWAGASGAWEALGYPYEAAVALLDGDETAVRIALATLENLGARPAASLAARRLRDLGARGVPRGPRPTTRANPANLTARELEILPFLIAGQRNAEIAKRLFLSPKTVDHHVGRILSKLGVHSRKDAASAADRLGLFPTPDQDRAPDPPI